MTRISRVLVQSAAAAALALSGLALGATAAGAQPIPHDESRCTNDACATYHCDADGCRRVSDWRYDDRSYIADRSYYYSGSDRERCFGDRCATFRCDANGDNCSRVSDWRYH